MEYEHLQSFQRHCSIKRLFSYGAQFVVTDITEKRKATKKHYIHAVKMKIVTRGNP